MFSKTSLHEQYAKKLIDAGLKETALGRQWFSAADKALSTPVKISLPYKEVGYFPADNPRAVGLQFSVKHGEKLNFELNKKPTVAFALYTDLWEVDESGKTSRINFFDTSKTIFFYEVEETTNYILRIQPELLRSGEYTLSIAVGASLGYPVAGKSASIGSLWGDPRDAGARKHQGIDIFAPSRTPVIAAEDGFVSTVNENNLGGKVVWMRPKGKNYTLYYAHLDEQLVSSGQRVKKGDTLGLMGNTGNARTTSPHLHFGIYSIGGAVDPLPFVNPITKKPPDVSIPTEKLLLNYRLTHPTKVAVNDNIISLKANTLLYPVSATNNSFRFKLPDEHISVLPMKSVQVAETAIKKMKIKDSTFVLEQPTINSPRKTSITKPSSLSVLGYFNDFAYVKTETGIEGWLQMKFLE
jgi:murein DD-endopeptidase MepM/ murein hydrolase activator NlpD